MSWFDNLILISGILLLERRSSCELASSANLLIVSEGLLSVVIALCKDKVNRWTKPGNSCSVFSL
ncbi:MAG: hypothetical protein ACJ70U_03770 [Nitrososphaera sp.]